MTYNTFTLKEIKKRFGVNSRIIDEQVILGEHQSIEVSDWLKETLDYNVPLALAISTEKARSELIVMPILVELRKKTSDSISIFSGIDFTVDQANGLNGRCDYIVSLDKSQLELTAPIITLVEAKNDNINSGIGQCVAEMLAAKLFNENNNLSISTIYGVVTTGSIWKFLMLDNDKKEVLIENREMYIKDLPQILGVLLKIINQGKMNFVG